jgi:putative membrane protein
MIRRTFRVLPLLAAALVLGLIGTASFALAHDKPNPDKQHQDKGDRHQSSQDRKHESSDNKHQNSDENNQSDDNNESSENDNQRSEKKRGDKRYSAWDEEWLKMSIEGDLFEIQGGKIAQEKGTTQKVRDLGATLVKDHSESLKEATDLAEELGIEVPTEPSPTQQWQLRVVQQFQGAQFDKWYSDLEVADHEQDIQEAQDEVEKGRNKDVRENAKQEIPVLQGHLKLAQDALASVGS